MATILRFLRGESAKLNPLHSLRTRLGLVIGSSAFVLSILASLVVGHTTSEQVKVDIGQSLAEQAHQMTDKLDREMFERYRDLQIISTLDVIRNPNSSVSQQQDILELQSTYTDYAWIGLASQSGIVQASTGKLLEGKDVSQTPWFVNGQKAPYMGYVHDAVKEAKLLANETGKPLRFVDVAVPVMDIQGNVRGVLGAYLGWTWSKKMQKSLLHSLNRYTEMFILSQNGDLLLAPPGYKTATLSLKSVKTAQREMNGSLIETWSDGSTYLTGFAQSIGDRNYPRLGWIVLVRQKTEVAFTKVRHLQQQIFTWNMILGALFAVLGWVFAVAIINPMLAIAAAVDRIRRGNKQVKIPVFPDKDEIANLSKSLTQLVSTLTQQEKDLKASNAQLQLEIRDKLMVQEMLRQSEEKFRQLAEISELKSQFIAIASHEFRTPLTTIVLSCDLLQNYSDKFSSEKKQRYFNKIKSSIKHLNQVLEDVLIIEAGKLSFKPAPLDLIGFCLDLVEQLQLGAGKRYELNFVDQCEYGCKTKDLPVMDEKLLRHILTNLLSNAIKYSPKGGNIEFDLICDQKSAIFRIQDEGIGIPEQDRAKLFTSFFRCSNAGNLPGTGLGLAIVKNAVELHGGQITVESEVGIGTTFTVLLPLNYTLTLEKSQKKGKWER